MKIVAEEKRDEFTEYMETIACVIYKESLAIMDELKETMSGPEIISNSKTIGIAAGQIVLDKVIDLTKDMSREELVVYLAEATAIAMTSAMNKSFVYRETIARKSERM